eukprot:s7762_g1.t1
MLCSRYARPSKSNLEMIMTYLKDIGYQVTVDKMRHRVSSHLGLQRQVFLAWCRTMEALRLAGPVQSALEDRVAECEEGFMHRELMRLKEESKHRAIDLLEVMALSREAAALTGSGGKSYASKNRRHRKALCIWVAPHTDFMTLSFA